LRLRAYVLCFAVAIGVYVAAVYFSANRPVEGWTPMMAFLAVGFSGVFILMSIMSKYLSLILDGVISKSSNAVSSIKKIVRE
jgi:dolichol-phosphate mannosyltransferase